jgi:hypothetical protein
MLSWRRYKRFSKVNKKKEMKQLQDYQIREILRICTHEQDGEIWGDDIPFGSMDDLILLAKKRVSEYEDEFEHLYDAYLDAGCCEYTFEAFVEVCEQNPDFKSNFER